MQYLIVLISVDGDVHDSKYPIETPYHFGFTIS